MPTASRSRVGTSEIAAAGNPASTRPATSAAWIARDRAEALGAAAQDGGVAGLQAQGACVRGDIRPALIDHADDAERHAHALDSHAVGPAPRCQDAADRVLQTADRLNAGRHGLYGTGSERQSVEEGGARPGDLCFGHILGVGGQDRVA